MNSNMAAVGIVTIVAVVSLLLFTHSSSSGAATVCSPDQMMYIEDGKQLSSHCINTPIGGTAGMFYRKQDLDNRRYHIAQRQWRYNEYENVK